MKTIGNVDWLAFTIQQDVAWGGLLPGLTHKKDYDWTSGSMNGYTYKWVGKNGAIVLKGHNAAMGMHVILSGSVLEDYRLSGITAKRIMQHVGRYGAKPSRIDIAIDVFEGAIKLRNVIAAYRTGTAKMPIKTALQREEILKLDESDRPGHTVEFGSRTSHRMLRVYDKGVEQGTGDNWIRFELEMKSIRAQGLMKKLQDDDLEMRPVINAEMAAFLNWKNPHWRAIVRDQQGYIEKVERKTTNTYQWLINTCASALAKYHLDNPDENAIEAFNIAVHAEVRRLSKYRAFDKNNEQI